MKKIHFIFGIALQIWIFIVLNYLNLIKKMFC